MDTIAWLFIFSAAALGRGLKNGRGFAAFGDLSDAFIGAIEGDADKVKEALGRTGDGNTTTAPAPVTVTASQGGGSDKGSSLLAQMIKIGTGKPYSQAAGKRNGPDAFDCSGLVWRAGADLGFWGAGTKKFEGGFNTASFIVHTGEVGLTAVSGPPVAGDIIWWVGHMGVATDSKNFFAARTWGKVPGIAPIDAIKHPGKKILRFVAPNSGAARDGYTAVPGGGKY